MSHVSNMMYIKVKDLVANGRYESIYELSYVLFGRNAIFIVCTVQYMLNFTAIILYFIILGDCMEQMSSAFALGPKTPKERPEIKE